MIIDLVLELDTDGSDEARFRNIQLSVKIMNGFSASLWYLYFIAIIWKLYKETYSNYRYEYERHKCWFVVAFVVMTSTMVIQMFSFVAY